jgi:3D (Asp-Asp-Asp) domain-containing protein
VIFRGKSALALGASMLLAAGLGVGYIVTSSSGQGSGCDSVSAPGCDRVGTVSTNLGAGTKAVDKNACKAVALTFFADSGAPAVTSNVFPNGTRLKITNLDNNKSTTVPVTGVSGSCALLNTAAMDQIRETGKNVVRRNTVEVVAAAAAPAAPAPAAPAGGGACNGVALTFSADAGAPAVTSNVFPNGTRLKITNLDNNKSTTVAVTGVSGSCALLNTAAMDQIRETGKNVVRHNTVERLN